MLAPGATLVLVAFDPADATTAGRFRSAYGIGGQVTLAGPFLGRLGNGGDAVRLLAPTDPPAGQTDPVHYLVDRVTYADAAPWPAAADGDGPSLVRTSAGNFGDAAASWRADDPTPGSVSFEEPVLRGDYNGSGLVEQADLDLVLTNWGQSGPPPTTWINDLPSGVIDQEELDKVLTSWGDALAAGATAAPAPQQPLAARAEGNTAKTPRAPSKSGEASDPCAGEASLTGFDLSKIAEQRDEPTLPSPSVRGSAKAASAITSARDAALGRWMTAPRDARAAGVLPLRGRPEASPSSPGELADRLFDELADDLLRG